MKIDQKLIGLNGAATPETAARARSAATAPAAPGGPAASVATRLPVGSAGDFDAARVAQIRQAIAAGRYQVNASRIADGLLDHVQELLGRRQ